MHRSFLILALLSALALTGCATHRPLQVAEHVTRDTVYLSSLQYDSIYIFQERTSDYHMNPLNPLKPSETDTVFIKDVSVEYHYKLLRDTIYKPRVDSIPVIREVEVVREVRHIPWYAKLLSWIGTLALLFLLIRVISYVKLIK